MRELLERLEILEGTEEFKQILGWMRDDKFSKPSVSYMTRGVEGKRVSKPGRDGKQKFSGWLIIGPDKRYGNDGGFYYSEAGQKGKFIADHPKDALKALAVYHSKVGRKAEAKIRKWIKDQNWKFMDDFVGDGSWNSRDEWDVDEKSVKSGTIKYDDAIVYDMRGSVAIPIKVKIEFEAKKKTPVHDRPFDEMSNSELDELIWENEGPEGVYMDGEMTYSIKTRMKELRDWYRKKSPREQQAIMDDVIKIKRGHYR